jgi:hypothetical protein
MLTIAVTGLVGNVLSFCVLGRELKNSSTSVFLRALAVADNAVLLGYTFYFSIRAIYRHKGYLVEYYEFFQRISIYLFTSMVYAKCIAVYLIVFVTAERFIAVCRPLKAQSLCTVRNAKLAIFGLTLVSLLYKGPNLMLVDVIFVNEPCSGLLKPLSVKSKYYLDPTFEIIYVQALPLILDTIIPITIMIYANYSLIKALRSTAVLGTGEDKRRKESLSLTKRVISVSIIFIILETPMPVTDVFYTWGSNFGFLNDDQQTLLYHLIYNYYILSTINSFINFYVYCLTGRSFRKALYRMFRGEQQSSVSSR